MKLNEIKTAYISGASKGIGFEYAKKLMNMGVHAIGVARNMKPLIEYAQEMNQQDLLTTFEFDLGQESSVKSLIKELDKFDLDLMINNAGFGYAGSFIDNDLDHELALIDLNIKSLHQMTKYFYQKYYDTKTPKRIINLASVAAFTPGPLHAAYFASKSYVLSLSNAIGFELKKAKSKLSVFSVCPGPIATDFWKTSEYTGKKLPGGTMTVTKLANLSFKKMITSKKSYAVIGSKNRAMVRAARTVALGTALSLTYKMNQMN